LNRVFAELYLDEDVTVVLAEVLRARGFSVTTTQEAGQLGNSDEDQLASATRRAKVILTHNRLHFEALGSAYFEAGRPHGDTIIAVRRDYRELARRVVILLNSLTPDEMANQIR